MRWSPLLLVALAAAYSGPALGCSCAFSVSTPEDAFRAVDVYVEGEVANPEAFAGPRPETGFGRADGPKVRLRVTRAFKGARTGDVIEYPFEASTCGVTVIPPRGQTVTIQGTISEGIVWETRCIGMVQWPEGGGNQEDGSAAKAYMELLEGYPLVREGRLARARRSASVVERSEIAKAFVEDRDARSADEVLATLPANDEAYAELRRAAAALPRTR